METLKQVWSDPWLGTWVHVLWRRKDEYNEGGKLIMVEIRVRKQEMGMWRGEEAERDWVLREEGECKKKGKGSWWCHVAWLEWKSGLGFQQRARESTTTLSLSPAMSESNPVLWPRRIRICVSFSLYMTTSTNNNNS